jgi:serine phosphatase RsbU (regulator of sigma subunit)/anti-sigma regulatory factor (Ser/Thr protein kinase)
VRRTRRPLRLARSAPGTSWLGAPLVDRTGDCVGVIELCGREGGDFTAEDEAALVQLTLLASGRIESARLFERERTVARTLQDSMLASERPTDDAVEFDWAYLPATEDLDVGGDWYDVVPVRDGCYAVVIGDVVGHGLEAAATMGQLRNSLRTYLVDGIGPAAALNKLAHLVAVTDDRALATIFCARLDLDTLQLTFSNAGHPPPLLSAGGAATWLEGARGVPLGARVGGPYVEATCELRLGDAMLMYTDGLVDRRGASLIDEMDRLQEIVRHPTSSAQQLVDRVVLGHVPEHLPDDVALLGFRLKDGARLLAHFGIPARTSALSGARAQVDGVLAETVGSAEDRHELVTAFSEALTNAIEHAQLGPDDEVDVRIGLRDGEVEIVVRDQGSWRPPSYRPERGRGIKIMQAFADTTVDSSPTGTTVRLRRRLSPQP